MDNAKQFTISILQAQDIDPMMDRWLDSFIDLKRSMSEKVISLCRYYDKIPNDALSNYANLLIEALDNREIKNELLVSETLSKRIGEFAEALNEQGEKEKTIRIIENMKQDLQK